MSGMTGIQAVHKILKFWADIHGTLNDWLWLNKSAFNYKWGKIVVRWDAMTPKLACVLGIRDAIKKKLKWLDWSCLYLVFSLSFAIIRADSLKMRKWNKGIAAATTTTITIIKSPLI